jgi:hypothetical protein
MAEVGIAVMLQKLLLVSVLVVSALVLYDLCSEGETTHPPGILAPGQPRQTVLDKPKTWEKDGYLITALARFSLQARLICKERYWFDRGADLSPVDYVLGWGPMSDQKILDQLKISQGGRWYHWQARHLPISAKEINSHCANMHIIPANEEIDDLVKQARPGDIVQLDGYLVAVSAQDGWRWRSSLSRTDTGNGSCELIWVENFAIRY